jgi:hypothetical protein
MTKKIFLFFLAVLFPACLLAAAATINVDYGTDVAGFDYGYVLGDNMAFWIPNASFTAAKDTVYNSGCRFIRFPGGSMSNDYHWNGTGSYVNDVWTCSPASWTRGFMDMPTYRGSTSNSYPSSAVASRLTDGDTSDNSQWRSDTVDAYAGETPYVVVLFNSGTQVNGSMLYWSAPYAVSYDIQYWTSTGDFDANPNWASADHWTTVKSVTSGAGGTDGQSFSAVTSRNIRFVFNTSSGEGFRLNEVKLFYNNTTVTVNTNSWSAQTPTMAFPTDISNYNMNSSWIPDFGFDDFMSLINSMAGKVEPLITVNFGTGTPEEAAAWVNYANNVQHYGIKYWEVGNEPEGAWEAGGPVDAKYYAAKYIRIASAMKAADPSIKIFAPPVSDMQRYSGSYDGYTFIEDFLRELQAQGQLALCDGIAVHMYADWNFSDAATILATPANWAAGLNWKAVMDGIQTRIYGSPDAKDVIMSEYNSGDPTMFMMGIENALWAVNWLGEYIKAFGYRAKATLWTVMDGNPDATNYDFGYIEKGQQTNPQYRYQPRSTYWAHYIMGNYFVVPDPNGNSLVSAACDQALLPVYACRRSDGTGTLMVVNKDPSNSYTSTINISNYAVNSTADLYTFAAAATTPYYVQNYAWHAVNPSAYADPDLPPNASLVGGISGSFSFTFPPYSISVFRFCPAGSTPTLTPTISPTVTATPTATATPAPGMYSYNMIDDCENIVLNTNNWQGSWYNYKDSYGQTTVTSGKTAGGEPGSTSGSYHASGYLGTTSGTNYVYMGVGTTLDLGDTAVDLTQYKGLQFAAMGDGKTSYTVKLKQTDITDSAYYMQTFSAPAGWTTFTLDFTSFSQPSWKTAGVPLHLDKINEIQWSFTGEGQNYDFYLDDIQVYSQAATTPTPAYMPDLNKVYVYPSLVNLKSCATCSGITFYGLTAHTRIGIFNMAGEQVYSDEEDTPSGQLFVQLKQGQKWKNLSSGLYIYVVFDGKNNYKTGKFAIVR